jgi:putative endonuclease
MTFYVYIIKTLSSKVSKTYAGYTNDLNKRLSDHNNNKGAKSTKGHKWELIYKKKFISKSKAMSYEYKIKKNRKLRKEIISSSIK